MVITTSVKVAAVSKVKSPKAKKPSSKPSHPPTSTLVNGAIRALKERSGSSLQAIKKYIAANNKVDADKLAPFIKKYLKNAVADGKLIQTKGKGASGSFKLATVAKTSKPKKGNKSSSPAAKKSAAKKPTAKKTVAKAAKKPKKPKVKLSKPAALKQKPTKRSKAVTKKTKSPKPKTSTKKLVTATKK